MAGNATNIVHLTGNLTADPELRFTPNGIAVANVRIAVNDRRYNKETQAWDDVVDGFFTCNVWRELAEHVADSLRRGDRVAVVGRLKSRSYTDKEGAERWVTEVEVDEISPSLRWATAQVSKAQSRNGGQQGGSGGSWGGGAAQPAAAAAAAAGWGGSSAPSDDVPF